jgi:hypothetical protein
MSETPLTAEIVEMRRMIETARKRFRAKARAVLFQAYRDADSISSAIGEVSVDEAFAAWSRELIKRLHSEE